MDEEKNNINNNEGEEITENSNEEADKCITPIETYDEKEEKGEEHQQIENESINNNEKHIKKKRNIIVGSIILVVAIISIFINVFVGKYENVVYPGITAYDEDISKLNERELDKKLNELASKLNDNKICINTNGQDYYINANEAVLGYNVKQLSNSIITYGKDKNVIQKFYQIVTKQEHDFKFKININNSYLSKIEDNIAEETNKEIQEPQVIINGTDIAYKGGKDGLKLAEDSLAKEIESKLIEENATSEVIKIDAQYKIDKQTISMSALKKVNTKISTYSTTYSPSGGRGSNVENAAKKLDDMLLMPGEEFSYENSVGPVVQSNGYQYAHVISNGELVQGIGGGVCQVSSTLYNTMLKAGILPTERRNHSKAVNYVPRGLDATLASGSIDYKFVNTLEYPIVINTHCSGGILTIEFWSNEGALKGIEYKPVSYASGKTANTYLYGYDKDGNKIYEKHIDTSIYR